MPLRRLREQRRVLLNGITCRELSLSWIDFKMGDAHGRYRVQELRIQHAEHGGGDFGKFAFDIVLNARRQECERFDQPFHVRIGGLNRTQFQAIGDLRIAFGKFAARFAEIGQFPVVVLEKVFPAICPHVVSR